MNHTAKTFRIMDSNLYGFHILNDQKVAVHTESGFTSKTQAKINARIKLNEMRSLI